MKKDEGFAAQPEQSPVLSVEELSRRIAEHIEPFASLGTRRTDSGVAIIDNWPLSDKRVWALRSDYQTGDVLTWQPRDMREPGMTVMLTERLLRQTDVEFRHHRDHGSPDMYYADMYSDVECLTLGELVVRLFALQFNLATEDELRRLDTSPTAGL